MGVVSFQQGPAQFGVGQRGLLGRFTGGKRAQRLAHRASALGQLSVGAARGSLKVVQRTAIGMVDRPLGVQADQRQVLVGDLAPVCGEIVHQRRFQRVSGLRELPQR